MAILLIDIGNSRIKWALLRGTRLGRQQVLPLEGGGAASFAALCALAGKVTAVIAVSVAGQTRDRALVRCLKAVGLPTAQFITSSREAGGVQNGYRDVWRLGADRWVAAIGAWHEAGQRYPVCVVDVGTATTVDVVDAAGVHQGGLIAPGPSLMVSSLLKGTRGIAVRAQGSRRRGHGPLATDTGSAILAGALEASAALIERSAQQSRQRFGRGTRVYLTGGGATALVPLLQLDCTVLPDLVLRGLAVLARDAASAPDG